MIERQSVSNRFKLRLILCAGCGKWIISNQQQVVFSGFHPLYEILQSVHMVLCVFAAYHLLNADIITFKWDLWADSRATWPLSFCRFRPNYSSSLVHSLQICPVMLKHLHYNSSWCCTCLNRFEAKNGSLRCQCFGWMNRRYHIAWWLCQSTVREQLGK